MIRQCRHGHVFWHMLKGMKKRWKRWTLWSYLLQMILCCSTKKTSSAVFCEPSEGIMRWERWSPDVKSWSPEILSNWPIRKAQIAWVPCFVNRSHYPGQRTDCLATVQSTIQRSANLRAFVDEMQIGADEPRIPSAAATLGIRRGLYRRLSSVCQQCCQRQSTVYSPAPQWRTHRIVRPRRLWFWQAHAHTHTCIFSAHRHLLSDQ